MSRMPGLQPAGERSAYPAAPPPSVVAPTGDQIPAGLLSVAVIAAAIVITSQQHREPAYGPQVTLPFTGLNGPTGVAVDTAGNVYVADYTGNRVVKLSAGSNTQAELPFTGLNDAYGVAVDTAGNVYVADAGSNRVLKLPAVSRIGEPELESSTRV
jgi:serine/threonine protein kinase, bacterial